MTAGDVELLVKGGAPDWERIEIEVCCARCGYNLRMLTSPRCPECGLEFEWGDALDQTEWRSGLLFEYHWRDRLVASWGNSVRRAFFPRRFWATVSLHDRIRPGPLWTLILISILVYAAIIGVVAEVTTIASELAASRRIGTMPGWLAGAGQSNFEILRLAPRWARMSSGPSSMTFHLAAANAVIVLVTLAMLGMLRQTLGRCRIRFAHILRVASYSATPASIWWAAIVLGAFASVGLAPAWIVAKASAYDVLPFVGMGLYVFVWAYYLAIGLRTYLHLPRAALLAIVCASVSALTYFTIHAVNASVFIVVR